MMRVLALIAALALSACSDDPVRVASKNFAENRILAEMFALLIEEAGIPVDREIPLGDTAAVFESLRTGGIDIYPEYTGTGLALLGLPPSIDMAAGRAQVAQALDQLGVTALDPLGFETSYSVVVEAELARELDLNEVSDLADTSSGLRLVVAEGFAERPGDGLQAFMDRFGLNFDTVEVVPEDQRRVVYDRLVEDRADVAVGFGTDSEIAAYELETLDLGGGYSARYEAIPVVAAGALVKYPDIRDALAGLAGALDTETMRRLNGAVALDGRAPAEVAREALADLGLVAPGLQTGERPYKIAVGPADVGTPMANEVLRAARLSVEDRGVTLVEGSLPADAIFDRTARVAMAPSIAMFDFGPEGAVPRADLEAIAAVGSYLVHAFASPDGPAALGDAARIAAGPVGSPSHTLAQAIAGRSDPPKQVIGLEKADAATVADAIRQGAADAGIVLAPAGRLDISEVLESGGLRLIPADDWWSGAARLAYPFLGIATLPVSPQAGEQVPTLSMQAVVFGPAPSSDALGQQGPSTYNELPRPVTDQVVLAFNDNLGSHRDVGYSMRRADVLIPDAEGGKQSLNPTPGYTVLSLGIIAFLLWATWLLVRGDRPGRSP